jgi:glutaredoxin
MFISSLRGIVPRAEITQRSYAKETPMKSKAIFYHAGCPVCVSAEQNIARSLDPARYDVEVVHLGQDKRRLADAERAGVKSVPALVLDGHPFHINYGAALSDLK